MHIPNDVVPLIYDTVKLVNDRILTGKAGINILVEQGRINENTARDFIHIRRRMIDGKRFTRNSSAYITEYFLLRIKKDYGHDGLERALKSLKLHIEYYSKKRGTKLNKLRALYEAYSLKTSYSEKVDEQDEIIAQLKLHKLTREQLIDMLKQLKSKPSSKISIKGERYSRDNFTIALLKILRDFKCQICDTSILKANGSFYIEAAHIVPKRDRGEESSSNILILCPNHHKEFDYGKVENLQQIDERISFKLNGRLVDLPLLIE
ncbi:hypothetical protein EXU85_22730 [Spirosoma sp. KCTC 42546]|uniref:HNH endonuclease n=1 Tax=Spirosoma sp. KCTC 42546 TaxID=2520506 RepID=UPI00115ADB13|nr:HNH endonuclease [Spirosoma sp. KCTC 42546]QDK81272.1 hypothetical protein EXU85_22730 [Spirosoma sp. KCTC 42546]